MANKNRLMDKLNQEAWEMAVDRFYRYKEYYSRPNFSNQLKSFLWENMSRLHKKYPRHLVMPEKNHDE